MASSSSRPSELRVSDRYDRCIDLSLQRLVYGTLAGGLAGFVFFRTYHADCLLLLCAAVYVYLFKKRERERMKIACTHTHDGKCISRIYVCASSLCVWRTGGGAARVATLAFGSGAGAGSAYADCRREVRHAHTRRIIRETLSAIRLLLLMNVERSV